jgi:hypothetical protein
MSPVLALKLVRQNCTPPEEVLGLVTVRKIVNVCLGIELAEGVSSLKRLSLLSKVL